MGEVIGRRLNHFVHEDDRRILKEQMKRRRKGHTDSYELLLAGRYRKRIATLVVSIIVPRSFCI
jgi:hypothetical protein